MSGEKIPNVYFVIIFKKLLKHFNAHLLKEYTHYYCTITSTISVFKNICFRYILNFIVIKLYKQNSNVQF